MGTVDRTPGRSPLLGNNRHVTVIQIATKGGAHRERGSVDCRGQLANVVHYVFIFNFNQVL
jgi:hypothetical protein